MKAFIQLALLEQRNLEEGLTEYIGVYRATPHSTTAVSPAYLLHNRHPRTKLSIVGWPSQNFTDPTAAMSELRERVKKHQLASRGNVDDKRGARRPALQPGDYVRVKLPGHHAKGDLQYSKPRKMLDHRGRNPFLLDYFKV